MCFYNVMIVLMDTCIIVTFIFTIIIVYIFALLIIQLYSDSIFTPTIFINCSHFVALG